MTEGPPPPGWYDDGQGVVRWFDGTAWTDHVQASPEAAVPPLDVDDDPLWPDAPLRGDSTDAPAPPGHRASTRTADAPVGRGRWVLVAVVLLLVLAAGAFALTRGSDDDASPVTAPTTIGGPATSPSVPSSPTGIATTAAPTPRPTGLVDGEWTVVSYRFQDNGIGDFGGTARITYTGSEAAGGAGNFTFTVFKGGKQVATLVGSVLDARPGQTKATDLISTDRYRPGPYSAVRFRKDL